MFIAPLANLAATPLWIVLSAGNISVLLLPVCWTRGPLGARVQRAIRLTTVLGLIGALTLWVVGDRIGVTVLHTGATVWTASLFCGTLATWTPRLSGARIAARESSNPA